MFRLTSPNSLKERLTRGAPLGCGLPFVQQGRLRDEPINTQGLRLGQDIDSAKGSYTLVGDVGFLILSRLDLVDQQAQLVAAGLDAGQRAEEVATRALRLARLDDTRLDADGSEVRELLAARQRHRVIEAEA